MDKQSAFEKSLGIKDDNDYGVWIKSSRTLRHLIGVLGVLLPIILVIFSPTCKHPLESISHYYYVKSAPFLIAILSLIGVFLIIYTKNFMWSSIAGIGALFVVFFPTSQLYDPCCVVSLPYNPNEGLRVGFHYFSAAVFLTILAFMSIIQFPKADSEEIHMKKTRAKYKWLYIFCGIIMLMALATVGIRGLLGERTNGFTEFYDLYNLTFWMEVVALEAFGISWLVRGRETVKQSELKAYLIANPVSNIDE